jgi:hypothetical protein
LAKFWIESGTSGLVVTKSFFLEQLTICVERRNEVPFATLNMQCIATSGTDYVWKSNVIYREFAGDRKQKRKPPPLASDRRHPLSFREVFSISPTVVLSLGNLCRIL